MEGLGEVAKDLMKSSFELMPVTRSFEPILASDHRSYNFLCEPKPLTSLPKSYESDLNALSRPPPTFFPAQIVLIPNINSHVSTEWYLSPLPPVLLFIRICRIIAFQKDDLIRHLMPNICPFLGWVVVQVVACSEQVGVD